MDALLVFDCLMYLNAYYYFMFTIANSGIWIAKNFSESYKTPYIMQDAYVAASLSISELLKLLLFRKFRERYTEWSIVMAVSFTIVSACALLYVFIIQFPILRLEFCLDIMLFVLLCIEILYGIYTFIPCCKATEL